MLIHLNDFSAEDRQSTVGDKRCFMSFLRLFGVYRLCNEENEKEEAISIQTEDVVEETKEHTDDTEKM